MRSWLFRLSVVSALVLSGLAAPPAGAAPTVIEVSRPDDVEPPDPDACSDHAEGCSLREAVLLANDDPGTAHEIRLAAGEYTLSILPSAPDDAWTGDLDIDPDLELTVRGAGMDATTIVVGDDLDRAFQIGTDTTFALEDLAVRGASQVSGPGSGGGALLAHGHEMNLTVSGVRFEGHRAAGGGAIRLRGPSEPGSTLTVTGSEFVANTADGAGGAIWVEEAPDVTLEIVGTLFEGNTASWGGAIYLHGPVDVTIERSRFTANEGTEHSGAISASGGEFAPSSFQVADTEFADNVAGGEGGAVSARMRELMVERSTFAGNHSADGAGAIFSMMGSLLAVNSTIAGNTAASGVGGIRVDGGAEFVNVTLAGNSIDPPGAGVANLLVDEFSSVELVNTLVAGGGDGVPSCALEDADAVSFGGNVVDDGSCLPDDDGEEFDTADAGSTLDEDDDGGDDGGGDVVTDDVVSTLGELDDHGGIPEAELPGGGSTRTVALLPDSPAIDAGVDEVENGGNGGNGGNGLIRDAVVAFSHVPLVVPPFDQRGKLRVDGTGDGVAGADSGAFEFDPDDVPPPPPPPPPDPAPPPPPPDDPPGDDPPPPPPPPDDPPGDDPPTPPADDPPTEDPVPDVPGSDVRRLEGPDRISTAIDISERRFGDGEAKVVVLARSDLFPDALAGTPLAVDHAAPILLTPPPALHPGTEAELMRVLTPGGTVVLLGGTDALSTAVAEGISAIGFHQLRHGGADRYATAALIAAALGHPSDVLLASGEDFPDALAAGAAAAQVAGSVLLVRDGSVPAFTQAALDATVIGRSFAVGGAAARAVPAARPLVGATRYETAALVAEEFFPAPPVIGLSTGRAFADALTGGADIAARNGPMLLTEPQELSDATAAYLDTHGAHARELHIYGGGAAVSPVVQQAAEGLLAGRQSAADLVGAAIGR